MQVSYFETGGYYAPSNLPRESPMPAGAYDREAGLRAFSGIVERSRYAEELGFDWVSVSEHHYSPRILTPSLPMPSAPAARPATSRRATISASACRTALLDDQCTRAEIFAAFDEPNDILHRP